MFACHIRGLLQAPASPARMLYKKSQRDVLSPAPPPPPKVSSFDTEVSLAPFTASESFSDAGESHQRPAIPQVDDVSRARVSGQVLTDPVSTPATFTFMQSQESRRNIHDAITSLQRISATIGDQSAVTHETLQVLGTGNAESSAPYERRLSLVTSAPPSPYSEPHYKTVVSLCFVQQLALPKLPYPNFV